MPNFDKDNATHLWTPRPQNLQYTPIVGGTWLFFDADKEQQAIEWLVEEVSDDGKSCHVKKLTGENVGYRTVYDTEKLAARRWKPKTEQDAEGKYLWPCPACEQFRGVPIGDYICEECRSDQG